MSLKGFQLREFLAQGNQMKCLDCQRGTCKDACGCDDCSNNPRGPCHCDCDRTAECQGCKDARIAEEQSRYDEDFERGLV